MLGTEDNKMSKVTMPYDDRTAWEKLMNRTGENNMKGERGDY